MYMVDTFSTAARSIMDREPFPHHPTVPVAGDFYKHPYGGIARDIHVSKEGFARFFEWSLAEVDFAMLVSNGGKVIDDLSDTHECLGYVHQNRHGRRDYMITIIDHSTKAAQKHLVRTIEQYNLKDVEFTHKADPQIKVKLPAKEVIEHATRNW